VGSEGTRPRQPKDQRYANAYVFGAICPARDTGTALVLPRANVGAMQHHLDEISRCVAAGAHAVLTLDKAGWHTTRKLQVPGNISLLHLPARSPELNPTENIWQFLRQSYLSNRVFRDYDDVIEASSSAWNRLTAEQGRIVSIASADDLGAEQRTASLQSSRIRHGHGDSKFSEHRGGTIC
jgi:DDE superfamily endonuclease